MGKLKELIIDFEYSYKALENMWDWGVETSTSNMKRAYPALY